MGKKIIDFFPNNGWKNVLKDEFEKEYFIKLMEFVESEYEKGTCYPAVENIFNAFKYTDIDNVKVVILGQDPYHNVNQAHGLSFSVPKDQDKLPPSLLNIYKEIDNEYECGIPNNGYLVKWAKQGVLLLNTVLTVKEHEANSHKSKGWEKFTDRVVMELNKVDRPIVYMLWGAPAQKKCKSLDNDKHLVLQSPHPSPLSAYRGFFGCNHFKAANCFLKTNDFERIDWIIENN